ncbi:competence pheromone ComX [Saccharococcus caldoxylosilyticus]|uniref:ComX pheromone n=1 Tax=Saccharococcus thermophilus TaxID=29396 RepID=A0A846MLQ3_9BACL|nr:MULTISPECIES: competence pheromone ComX [Bacillaceae]NIK16554.1 competence protein ComX [Saccharococcus thermophilus]QXJ38156.1 Competence pheromone precursor [Parageobacillus caldoxylosilyticus]
MQEIIRFLVEHPEVIEKLQNGTVSLIGLSELEVKAIVEVFGESIKPLEYWV